MQNVLKILNLYKRGYSQMLMGMSYLECGNTILAADRLDNANDLFKQATEAEKALGATPIFIGVDIAHPQSAAMRAGLDAVSNMGASA